MLDEGGRVTFRDVRYEIESGTVTFASTRGLAPILDIRARAEVRGYDVAVPSPERGRGSRRAFSSDPPLSDEPIVGLLLTGAAGVSPTTTVRAPLANFASAPAASSAARRPASSRVRRRSSSGSNASRSIRSSRRAASRARRRPSESRSTPNWSVTYSQPLFEAAAASPSSRSRAASRRRGSCAFDATRTASTSIDLRRRTRS